MKTVIVAPSILGTDLGRISEVSAGLERSGADWLHLDVMDGVFVPVITFGAAVARSVCSAVHVPVEAHLMVQRPGDLVEAFAEAGCSCVTVHPESSEIHIPRLLEKIKGYGCSAGLALNPATSPEIVKWVADLVDLVLVMTVNPGYAGQKHMYSMHRKIREVRVILDEAGRSDAMVSVDGGVTAHNAGELIEAGATVLVSGTYITSSGSPAGAINSLRN